MKVTAKMTTDNFSANVRFSMYKRGITVNAMAQLFDISEKELNRVIGGKVRTEQAKKILQDIIKYF